MASKSSLPIEKKKYIIVDDDGEELKTPKAPKGLPPRDLIPLMKSRPGLFNPEKIYSIRLNSSTTGATFVAGTTTAKPSWDPTGNSEFSVLTAIFSEYRVRNVRIWVFPSLSQSSAGTGLYLLMCGSDPAGSLSGTPTDVTVGSLAKVKRWNILHGANQTLSMTGSGKLSELPAITPDGFVKVATSWTGQFALYAGAEATSTLLAFGYQLEWDIDFRARA
jgi:hypothetical protein